MRRNPAAGWSSLEDFLLFHDQQISRFDHFILHDALVFELTESQIFIRGRVFCSCDSYLDVDDTVVRGEDGRVQKVKYSYHAGVLLPNRYDLFRYDNAHPHRAHADAHHKHIYDPNSGREIKPPVWIGQARCPTLGDALAELESWCAFHLS